MEMLFPHSVLKNINQSLLSTEIDLFTDVDWYFLSWQSGTGKVKMLSASLPGNRNKWDERALEEPKPSDKDFMKEGTRAYRQPSSKERNLTEVLGIERSSWNVGISNSVSNTIPRNQCNSDIAKVKGSIAIISLTSWGYIFKQQFILVIYYTHN